MRYVVAVAAALLAIVFLLVGWGEIAQSRALQRKGVETQARIVNYRCSEVTKYAVEYMYTAGGTPFVQHQDVTPAFYASHPKGSLLSVRYLPEHPYASRPVSSDGLRSPRPWIMLTTGAAVLGFAVIAGGRRRTVAA